MIARHQGVGADCQRFFSGIFRSAQSSPMPVSTSRRALLRDQNNGQSGKIRRMPYVMPQQRKE
jgi:hypothetical protein